MATKARSLRFYVRRNCTAAAASTTSASLLTIAAAPWLTVRPRRRFSTTPIRSTSGQKGGSDGEESGRERIFAEGLDNMPALSPKEAEKEARMLSEMRMVFSMARRGEKPRQKPFWNEEEADTEMITDEIGEDEFHGDDITSMGHEKLDEHRERRHYARLAAWELPMLTKLAKPFEPPERDMALRFRYTSYMGEFHPAEKKVVVQFCPSDLGLTDVQQSKLKKLLASRYNPETEIAHMSCEMFEHQAQNKRYLGDLIQKLVAEAKDATDTFEDVPLDTRHHNSRTKPKFPKQWRITEERRKELQNIRARAFLLDQQRVVDGTMVDGARRIQAALAPPTKEEMGGKIAELVRVSNRGGPAALRH